VRPCVRACVCVCIEGPNAGGHGAGPQFTRFTGTKVKIPMQKNKCQLERPFCKLPPGLGGIDPREPRSAQEAERLLRYFCVRICTFVPFCVSICTFVRASIRASRSSRRRQRACSGTSTVSIYLLQGHGSANTDQVEGAGMELTSGNQMPRGPIYLGVQ
jgi:hypothetical protein